MQYRTMAVLLLLLAGCSAGPKAADGTSTVYGVVTARAHAEILAKWSAAPGGKYPSYGAAAVKVPNGAIDYSRLTDIHVGVIERKRAAALHEITFLRKGTSPDSLAVGLGDTIRVRNRSGRSLTFFLAATEGEGFQSLARIPPNGAASFAVKIQGLLELGTDEIERLSAPVLARRGLRAQRRKSGQEYRFANLAPGANTLIVWHWRLGLLERRLKLSAGEASRVDEILAVDRTVR